MGDKSIKGGSETAHVNVNGGEKPAGKGQSGTPSKGQTRADEILAQLQSHLFDEIHQQTEAQYAALDEALRARSSDHARRLQSLKGNLDALADTHGRIRTAWSSMGNTMAEMADKLGDDVRNSTIQSSKVTENVLSEADATSEAFLKHVSSQMGRTAAQSEAALAELAAQAEQLINEAQGLADELLYSTMRAVEDRKERRR